MMLGLPNDDVDRIAHGALLHDVGKLAMPAELLGKEGPLTPDEWAIMSQHPIAGERILARTKDLAGVAPIVRHEHEHWDGSGYPDGLAGPPDPDRLTRRARVPRLRGDAHRAALPRRARARARSSPSCTPRRARSSTRTSIDALLDLLGHNAPDVPNRAEGVKLVAPTPREPKSRRSSSAGVGTGRVTSVAE